MQKLCVLFWIICFTSHCLANNWAHDTIDYETDFSTENYKIISVLDSLLAKYNNQSYDLATDASLLNIYGFHPSEIPCYPDTIYQERLASLESPIHFDYNEFVQNFIDLYIYKRREQVSRMPGLASVYYPMIEKVLDQNELPLELKHLVIVESALNPNAVSRAGATGMWQLMYPTAKQYGIFISSYIDERRDPNKSTVAAVKFLKDLYEIYNDWLLVIAAYNCGPGNVNRAIRRSGGKTNFWTIR